MSDVREASSRPSAAVVAHPAGHQGTLTTAAGEQLPVRTYPRGEEVVLVVLADIGDPFPAEGLDPATLQYTSRRGVIRLRGEAVLEDRALVRFRADSEPEVTQRRAFVRVHAPREVTLGPLPAGDPLRAHAIDLSGGGMLLSRAPTLDVDDSVSFEIRLGDEEIPVQGVARVLRIDESDRRALAFEQIAEGDRERLIRYVFECLRAARAKTRGDLV